MMIVANPVVESIARSAYEIPHPTAVNDETAPAAAAATSTEEPPTQRSSG